VQQDRWHLRGQNDGTAGDEFLTSHEVHASRDTLIQQKPVHHDAVADPEVRAATHELQIRDRGGQATNVCLGTAILFLPRDGEKNRWHRVDAAEHWVRQAGASVALRRSPGRTVVVGLDRDACTVAHAIVPAGVSQAARPLGSWRLCCYVVMPAVRFDGFELAKPGWEPE
jgi:predicted cupin superfamily sugar epimerase